MDGLMSFVLGGVVALGLFFSEQHPSFGRLMSVVVTAFVSFTTTVLMYHVLLPHGYNVCFFAIVLSSVVQLLSGTWMWGCLLICSELPRSLVMTPILCACILIRGAGLSLTTGVIELASGSLMSGSARIFNAILNTLMVGFGMSLGANIAYWIPHQYDSVCEDWINVNGQAWGVLFFLT